MLKIKDNIDLKELEKYGFKPKYDEDTGKIYKYEYVKNDYMGLTGHKFPKTLMNFFKRKKGYYFTIHIYIFSNEVLDILYDLIQAGLVEKVEK